MAMPAAPGRFPKCQRADIAAAARASSSRRPRARNVRGLRRHRPNMSEDGGSYSRPAERACGDRARSARALPRVALGTARDPCWNLEALDRSCGGPQILCASVCATSLFPSQGTCTVRQLRHTLLTLRGLLVAAQQVPMDERVFARIPFYDA